MDVFGNIDNTVIGNFNLLAIILGPPDGLKLYSGIIPDL